MKNMFYLCGELERLDLSNFDTSNVTNMENMFNKCRKLQEIKGIKNFNTKNVTNMTAMFNNCNELRSLDLSNFNSIKVTNMHKMFEECFELEYLDLSNFNTSNVIDMSFMFNKCYKLKEIKGINNFNMKKVNNIIEMFSDCFSLKNNNELLPQLNKSFQNIELVKTEKKLITVYFNSSSQHIKLFPITCYNTDPFSSLEEKLYIKNPSLKQKDLIFLSGGKIIITTQTLVQNKIKDKDVILIND